MGQTFTGLLKAVRARTGQGSTARSAPTAALRLCGDYLAGLTAGGPTGDAPQTRLLAAIGGLTTACGTDGDDLFDALLRTGQRALEAGGETETHLALDIAVEATALRARSKGAWRLRGGALEALGRRDEAEQAYGEHLALQQNPAAAEDIVRRVATLRDLRACLEEAAGLLPGEDGDALRALHNTPAGQARTVFAGIVRRHTAERGGMADPAVRRFTARYAAYRRLLDRDRMADPLLGGAEPAGVGALRRLIAGRSVCLVAGAARIADEEKAPGSPLGRLIDGYDLVVRCDTLPAAAPRTDLHAVTLRGTLRGRARPGTAGRAPGWSSVSRCRSGAVRCAPGWSPARRTTSATPRCGIPWTTRPSSVRTAGARERAPRSPCSGCWTSWTRPTAWTSSASDSRGSCRRASGSGSRPARHRRTRPR